MGTQGQAQAYRGGHTGTGIQGWAHRDRYTGVGTQGQAYRGGHTAYVSYFTFCSIELVEPLRIC